MAKEPEQEQESFEIRKAVRHAVPQLLAIAGPTFSGKTYGAILVASGLVEPGEKIGAIDTENGRFSAYADDPDVQRLIPQGIDVIELHPPFHPKRYIGALRALEQAGCKLVITDSGTHAWDGQGGAQDIKEKDKGWNNAKLWMKRYGSALRYSSMHNIVCLRAQEKVKIVGTGKNQEYIPLGMSAITEKNMLFDLGVYIMVEGEIENRPATHLAMVRKWPKAMSPLFADWKPQLLTPEVGRRIREWNNSASAEDQNDRLKKQAQVVALEGVAKYAEFFAGLTVKQKRVLSDSIHAGLKEIAKQADLEEAQREPEPDKPPTEEEMRQSDLEFHKRQPIRRTNDLSTPKLGHASL